MPLNEEVGQGSALTNGRSACSDDTNGGPTQPAFAVVTAAWLKPPPDGAAGRQVGSGRSIGRLVPRAG